MDLFASYNKVRDQVDAMDHRVSVEIGFFNVRRNAGDNVRIKFRLELLLFSEIKPRDSTVKVM